MIRPTEIKYIWECRRTGEIIEKTFNLEQIENGRIRDIRYEKCSDGKPIDAKIKNKIVIERIW